MLLYLRCSAETAKINLIVFLIYVVLRSGAQKWNLRRLSEYELAGNEMFLRHDGSSGDWGNRSAVWVEWSAI